VKNKLSSNRGYDPIKYRSASDKKKPDWSHGRNRSDEKTKHQDSKRGGTGAEEETNQRNTTFEKKSGPRDFFQDVMGEGRIQRGVID